MAISLEKIQNLRTYASQAKNTFYDFLNNRSDTTILTNLNTSLDKVFNYIFTDNLWEKIQDLNKIDTSVVSSQNKILGSVVTNIANDYNNTFLKNYTSPIAVLIEGMRVIPSNFSEYFELKVCYTLNNLLLLCDLYEEGLVDTSPVNLEL